MASPPLLDNDQSEQERFVYQHDGLPGTSALPMMVQASVGSPQASSHLAAPRPLVDPHRRCITPPRPTSHLDSTTSSGACSPCSFLAPGLSFIGQQYWPSPKSRKRKHALRGVAPGAAASETSSSSSRTSREHAPDQSRNLTFDGQYLNTVSGRISSLVREMSPDLRQLLQLPSPSSDHHHHSLTPFSRLEVEVEADSDTDLSPGSSTPTAAAAAAATSSLQDSQIQRRPRRLSDDASNGATTTRQPPHVEMIDNIRRLREITEQTTEQIQRIHESLPPLSGRTGGGARHSRKPHQVRVPGLHRNGFDVFFTDFRVLLRNWSRSRSGKSGSISSWSNGRPGTLREPWVRPQHRSSFSARESDSLFLGWQKPRIHLVPATVTFHPSSQSTRWSTATL